SNLRSRITWHREYKPAWDSMPDEYAERGVVQWGRSRRLGLFRSGAVKAYLGVQHIDPNLPGWNIVDAPEARFFLSVFDSGRCIALRTYPSIDAALDALAAAMRSFSQE